MAWLPVSAGLLSLSLAPAAIGQAAPPVVNPSSAPDGVLGSFSALGAGTDGTVTEVVIADDTVYAGGFFGAASGVPGTDYIAAWSDDTWNTLGTGTSSQVMAMTLADDTLYAGGFFTTASGLTVNRIAAWSDDTWSALGAGTDNAVRALAVSSDDTLYAGGSFTTVSGVTVNRIAAWSDDTWSALGTGVGVTRVNALAVSSDDTVYAGGDFTTVSGVTVNRIAAWSDDTWSALGTGMNNVVFALAVASDGTVYAGGGFTTASGVAGTRKIAAWSDGTWSALGTGLNDWVYALAIDDARGLVYAGGDFTGTAGGAITLERVGVWDAGIAEWIPFSFASGIGVDSTVYSVAVDDSVVYLGGSFTDAGAVAAADHIVRWTWEPPQGSNSLSALAGASVTLTGEGFIGVPATGGVKVGSTVTTYTRDDSTTITMTVPAGSFTNAPITVDGVGGWGEVGVLNPASPEPTPAVPAGPPLAVVAVAGDASASVRWAAPTSTGSFPVTNYQVMSSLSGGMCLTTTLTCEVTGLTNGTDYTFIVRALTGAGWSSWSTPSAVITPQRPEAPSIMITGARADMRGKPGVVVTGTTTGFGMGAILRPWIRFPGQTSYTQGTASILVDVQGGFTWERRTGKRVSIFVRSEDGTVVSNRLILRRT